MLSSQVWSYLNLNLVGEALVPFRNVAPHEGFEAWRKTLRLARSRGEVRRMELTSKVQRPSGASKLADVGKALEAWDTDMREFIEAGGRGMSFDERKLALLNIVPEQVRADIMIRLHMFPEPAPGSSQAIQDEIFTKLSTTLLKQIDFTY